MYMNIQQKIDLLKSKKIIADTGIDEALEECDTEQLTEILGYYTAIILELHNAQLLLKSGREQQPL